MTVITALILAGTIWSGTPGAASAAFPDESSGIEISVTIDKQPDAGGALPATGGGGMVIGGGIGLLLVAGGALMRRRNRVKTW